jgi:hypothetical protein
MSKAKEFMNLVEQRPELPDAEELVLQIDNEQPLYNRKVEMFKNLTRKKKSGKYDASLAPKLFAYLVDEAAKVVAKFWNEYNEINPPMVWNKVYTKEVRAQAAQELVKNFEAAYDNKEFSFMED